MACHQKPGTPADLSQPVAKGPLYHLTDKKTEAQRGRSPPEVTEPPREFKALGNVCPGAGVQETCVPA